MTATEDQYFISVSFPVAEIKIHRIAVDGRKAFSSQFRVQSMTEGEERQWVLKQLVTRETGRGDCKLHAAPFLQSKIPAQDGTTTVGGFSVNAVMVTGRGIARGLPPR